MSALPDGWRFVRPGENPAGPTIEVDGRLTCKVDDNLGPYDEDPDLPLSYAPRPLAPADTEEQTPSPAPAPKFEDAHGLLRRLGYGTGEADTMLRDLAEVETAEEWLKVLWQAAVREGLTR